jgi:hypothetical protein
MEKGNGNKSKRYLAKGLLASLRPLLKLILSSHYLKSGRIIIEMLTVHVKCISFLYY